MVALSPFGWYLKWCLGKIELLKGPLTCQLQGIVLIQHTTIGMCWHCSGILRRQGVPMLDSHPDNEWGRIHANKSARMLNSLGADLSPKGIQWSMYIWFFHLIPSRWQSAGWTGSSRKALLISILANIVSLPDSRICRMTSSMVT